MVRRNQLPTFLTAAEVAALLRVSAQTVRRWLATGRLPVVRVGHRLLVDARELRSFAKERVGA